MSLYDIITAGVRTVEVPDLKPEDLPAFSDAEAYAVVRRIARSRPYFTTDDIWTRIAKPNEPRRIAAVLARAKRDGLADTTGITQASRQGTNKGRPVRVWKSLIYRDR